VRESLDKLKQKWYGPKDNFKRDVLIPAMSTCEKFDCMSGYFNSGVLRDLAHGLAAYLINTASPLRLLVSSEISTGDHDALAQGLSEIDLVKTMVEKAFNSKEALESALINHTKSCLAYLVWQDRLQIRFVLPKNGLFHPKQYFFFCHDDVAILNGSANATSAGMSTNIEQLTLQRSWRNQDEEQSCKTDIDFFNSYWFGRDENSVTVDLPTAIAKELLTPYRTGSAPTLDSYERALQADQVDDKTPTSKSEEFKIPNGLNWETGLFKHQGDAVRAWEAADRNGILAMATGSGKTATSLIAAQRLSASLTELLIVIAVPTRPLLRQWEKDVRSFGLIPYVADSGSAINHLRVLDRKLHELELKLKKIEVVIVTHHFLKTVRLKALLTKNAERVLLIADEVHHLGVTAFVAQPPDVRYRLGLSATPARQYDEDGTEQLLTYFGQQVFEFSLEEAIGVCLVPYRYHVHDVLLTIEEHEEYRALSSKIGRASFGSNADGPPSQNLVILLAKRKRIVESAASKIDELEQILTVTLGVNKIRHTLIYCTDKGPEQLNAVNDLLTKLNISFHQITDNETSDQKLVSDVLNEFRIGNLKVLTAKRVLDEGFNIQEINCALILASTTSKRQWTQRRGRVLRLCPAIDKKIADIYDLIALPEVDRGDDSLAAMVKPELDRAKEFARLCKNQYEFGGPNDAIHAIERRYLDQ